MTTAQFGQRTLLEPGTADVCVTPVICFVMINYLLNCLPGRTVAFVLIITRSGRLAGWASKKEVWD